MRQRRWEVGAASQTLEDKQVQRASVLVKKGHCLAKATVRYLSVVWEQVRLKRNSPDPPGFASPTRQFSFMQR